MKLIVGLGNPGKEYEKTRHNVGFVVVDLLVESDQFDSTKAKFIKPQTFMNNSGQEVKKMADYYKIAAKDITVIHDDIDLPLGEIKVQESRGSAGHKGVQSIIDALGTNDFTRVRIGIRPEELTMDTDKFVLEKFTSQEQEIIDQTTQKAAGIVQTAL